MTSPSAKTKLASLYTAAPQPHRRTMLSMRKTILEILPNAEEVISYGMPAFKVSGNIICGLKDAKNHVGYYPFSGSVLPLLSKELRTYSKTKSAIHVPIDKPLTKALIKKLLQVRISQCPVKRGEVQLGRYEELDGYWKSIGIAAPARRGLVDRKILKLSDLKRLKKSEFLKIHGIGTNASATIEKEMRKHKIKFQS